MAQMAFMLLAVGLGWSLLALTHLVGHGLYKAGRFMAAGGATEARARLRRRSATGTQQTLRWRIGGAVGILLVAWAAAQAIGADGFAAMAVFGPAAAVVWWARTATATRTPSPPSCSPPPGAALARPGPASTCRRTGRAGPPQACTRRCWGGAYR